MKLIEITGYLITHDDVDESELATAASEILSNEYDCIGKSFHTRSTELSNWSDDHELNSIHSSADDCKKYFNN